MTTSRYSKAVFFWGLLSIFLLILASNENSLAETSRCPCKYQSAIAQGWGTCSRSEDSARCTIEFYATNPDEYKKLVNKLREIGLYEDPRQSLNFVNNVRPEQWDVNFVREKLPVIFAISQRFGFEDKITITKKLLENNDSQILKALQEPSKKECIAMESEGYSLNIGHGCIEIYKDDFSSMVKTPWSGADFYCNFETPEWLK